ncbi:MAG: hypothetical protein COA45_00640 [Zetaproteobacteria bacterium]|nr:MAG: hypothetical protein COA45_00640 [Zetaproteobacteria bacterium]
MIASLIIALHLMGVITIESAITSLYVTGALLIIAEIGIISFGLLFMNGLLAIYAGYALQVGQDLIFGIPIGWSVLFGIAFIEMSVIGTVVGVHLWLRKKKHVTGIQSMIGEKATIIDWDGKHGSICYEGETWRAESDTLIDLNQNDTVTIAEINKLDITISV